MQRQLFDKRIAREAVKIIDENTILRNYITEKDEEIVNLKNKISDLNAEIYEFENLEIQNFFQSSQEPISEEPKRKKCGCIIL